MQVKNNLKLISVSQYLKKPSSSSFYKDERQFVSGFLDTIQVSEERHDDIQLITEVPTPTFNSNYNELNSLNNICGYILQSIKKQQRPVLFVSKQPVAKRLYIIVLTNFQCLGKNAFYLY